VDPMLPVLELRTMEDIKQTALSQRRQASVVTSAFGMAGGALALCGVYGLVAFVVTRERRDMGVRLALGASADAVLRQVVGRLLRLGSAGIITGVIVARFLEPHVVASLSAQPMPFWPRAAMLAIGLALVSAAAAWVPARRILTLDPVRVLGE